MKYAKYISTLAVVLLIASISLMAADKPKDSGRLNLTDTVQIGSTQLMPGDYKVEWSGSADNVQVNILKGKNVIATTQGKIVQLSSPAANNAVVTRALDNNTRGIEQIQFDNRKEALQLGQNQMAAN
jgi:hypothetical protein